jgi:hypothetical protein
VTGTGLLAVGAMLAAAGAATGTVGNDFDTSSGNAGSKRCAGGRVIEVNAVSRIEGMGAVDALSADPSDLSFAGVAEADGESMDKVMNATVPAAMSAMRVRTAPPFVGRAKARLPLLGVGGLRPIAFGPRTEGGQAFSVLAPRRRVCGRFSYAQGWVVWTPLISFVGRYP